MKAQPVTEPTRPHASLAGRIDQACDQFEAALRAGRPVPIEEYLAGCEGPARGSLLRELLLIDVGCRRGRGEPVDPDAYRRRFPQHLEIVDRVLGAAYTETLAADPKTEVVATSRYSQLRFHDSGGLGEIFRAEDAILKRDVALKFIQPRHGSDPTCLGLFLSEAEITSRLDHPGVVPVYGIGESWDGRPFYAMRFVQGTRYKEEIEQLHSDLRPDGPGKRCSRLELHRLVGHLVSVCSTVAYAHNRGIIHRDIKPENIMIGRFRETTLLDWGLAIPVERDERARASGEKTMLVHARTEDKSSITGAGTIGYMSPEQLPESSSPIGPASDVYSLGATLYKLLTGATAFHSKHDPDVWDHIRRGEFAPPRAIKPDVPRALEAICLKAMATKPQDRYPGALELANDLQAWLADEPVAVYREPLGEKWGRWGRQHRNWLFVGVASVVLLMLAGFLSAAYQRKAAVKADSAHKDSMRMAARFAATTLATEIDLRWRILSAHAADHELHQCLLEMSRAPGTAAQRRLQDWLDRRRLVEPTPSESWFIDDAHGTQVARSPFNSKSINRNFAGRDYFHGLGRDLTPEEAAHAEPIRRVHRSTVYLSSNDGSLRVAFTVPIWRDNDPLGEPIGVLGMSVELGKFAALQTGLISGQTAALIDLREDNLEGQPSRGLLLHHRDLQAARSRRLEQGITGPFRIEPRRVQQLLALTQLRLREPAFGSDPLVLPGSLDTAYRDPLSGQTMTAVFEPVLVDSRQDSDRDTGWVVVIQQETVPD